MNLEESGFISLLNRPYPTYRFKEEIVREFASSCGQEQSTTDRRLLLTKVEAYANVAGNVKVGVDQGLGKFLPIPTNFARTVLSFLGLEASVSAEAFVQGDWKNETRQESTDHIKYGKYDEQWEVKMITISRRSMNESESYQPYGTVMIRKVWNCEANQPTEMTFASYFRTRYQEGRSTPIQDTTISLNATIIDRLNLPNNELDKGLVSINTQASHYKLLDHFIEQGVPKGIANFYIKEINVAEPRQ